MAIGKALRTGVMCAMGAVFSIFGSQEAMGQQGSPAVTIQAAREAGVESYTVTSVNITYDQITGKIGMSFTGYSNTDKQGQNLTASGKKTNVTMSVLDNASGTFGTYIAEAKLQDVNVRFKNLAINNRAKFSAVIAAPEASNINYLYDVNGNNGLKTQAYQVTAMHLFADNVPVFINGKAPDSNAASILAIVKEMTGTKLPVTIQEITRSATVDNSTGYIQEFSEMVLIPGR